DPNAALAVDPQAAPTERLEALRVLGFLDPEASAAELSRLARRRDTPFSPAAAPELRQLAARLVQEAAAAPDPDQALRPLADLTELRRFRIEELLRIGIHDVAGALETDAVAEQLSGLAEACVAACFDLASTEIERREGTPRHRDGTRASMVVIGLGKLGGREL